MHTPFDFPQLPEVKTHVSWQLLNYDEIAVLLFM